MVTLNTVTPPQLAARSISKCRNLCMYICLNASHTVSLCWFLPNFFYIFLMKISLNMNVCIKVCLQGFCKAIVFVKLIWSDLGIEKQHCELKTFTDEYTLLHHL